MSKLSKKAIVVAVTARFLGKLFEVAAQVVGPRSLITSPRLPCLVLRILYRLTGKRLCIITKRILG